MIQFLALSAANGSSEALRELQDGATGKLTEKEREPDFPALAELLNTPEEILREKYAEGWRPPKYML